MKPYGSRRNDVDYDAGPGTKTCRTRAKRDIDRVMAEQLESDQPVQMCEQIVCPLCDGGPWEEA